MHCEASLENADELDFVVLDFDHGSRGMTLRIEVGAPRNWPDCAVISTSGAGAERRLGSFLRWFRGTTKVP
jgi:hypothetical protein